MKLPFDIPEGLFADETGLAESKAKELYKQLLLSLGKKKEKEDEMKGERDHDNAWCGEPSTPTQELVDLGSGTQLSPLRFSLSALPQYICATHYGHPLDSN